MIRFLLALLFAAPAFGQLIPAANLPYAGSWTPHTSGGVGIPGGIPTSRTMYVNAITGALGGGGTYGGTLAAGNGVTDDTAAIQAMINSCPANKYVYLPAATYRTVGALTFNAGSGIGVQNIGLKGAGETSVIMSEAANGINVGPANGFVVPAGASEADMVVSGGLTKGSTSLAIGATAHLAVNQLVRVSADLDPQSPNVSVSGFRFIVGQVVRITAIPDGTHFSFLPALYSAYEAGAVAVKIGAAANQSEGIGIEDLKVNLVNASDGQQAIAFQQCYGCWVQRCRFTEVVNYPVAFRDSLQCESRTNVIDPRNASGTSGAGTYMAHSSGLLVENNMMIGQWITSFMGDDGLSGSAISRNYAETTNYMDTNHGAGPQFNVWEGNVAEGPIISDGYFGSERSVTIFNNYSAGTSLHRFVRDSNDVGNMKKGSGDVTGYPNFGNTSYTGTSIYYTGDHSDPWSDYGIIGTRLTATQGTASGYVVDGNHSIGATSILLKTGSGTLGLGDRLTFSGSAVTYWVQSFSGLTVVINHGETGPQGLHEAISDNASVTVSSIQPGTAAGYVINHGGGYAIGDTVLTVGTGTGTIKPNEVVSFSGGGTYRYNVVSLVGTTLTIAEASAGDPGLRTTIADGATVTVSEDRALFSYSSGVIRSFDGFYPQYPVLGWGSEEFQRYRVPVATATHFVVMNDQVTPNRVAAPVIGTVLNSVGVGSAGFQELDLAVALTRTLKGNRYLDDGHFDPLGGDTLPSSLIYGEVKPQWLIDEEVALGTPFNLQPFDPVTPTAPSASNIPAGYKFFFLIPPQVTSSSINVAGTEVSIGSNKPMFVGAGGTTSAILNGTITCTYDHISGSSIVFHSPTLLLDSGTYTVTLVNPVDGFQDVNGNDLPSITNYPVTNGSQETGGATWLQRLPIGDATDDFTIHNVAALKQGVDIPGAGNLLRVRFAVGGVNTAHLAAKVALLDTDGVTILGTGEVLSVTALDGYQAINISAIHVASAGVYYIAVLYQGNPGDLTILGATVGANSSFYSFNNVGYSAWPPATVLTDGSSTAQLSMGVLFAADTPPPGGSVANVAGTTTVTGTLTVP